MRQFISVLAILCCASPAFAGTTVKNPRVNNRPLDWCLVPTKQCGRPAADRYCDMKNLGHALSFKGERSSERTYILGTRELCDLRRFDHCDRFSVIECSAGSID